MFGFGKKKSKKLVVVTVKSDTLTKEERDAIEKVVQKAVANNSSGVAIFNVNIMDDVYVSVYDI